MTDTSEEKKVEKKTDEEGKPKPTFAGLRGVIIGDSDIQAAPYNIEEIAPLTTGQAMTIRARIRGELARMDHRKKSVPAFKRAVNWTLKAYGFSVCLLSGWVPQPTFGTDFGEIADYVHRKEMDAEAEEILEDEGEHVHDE
jgi:hypothetical protein